MTSRPPPTPSGADAGEDELFRLLDAAARKLVGSADPRVFLDWIAEAGPALAPAFAKQIDPRTGPAGLAFRAMGVAIYNAMPLPEAGFQARRIPEPGRNDPCSCGSGEKYKRCCLPLKGFLELSEYNMLRHVLDALLRKRFAELPASRVDVLAVYDTARQWHEEGEHARAVALLEPWFTGDGTLPGKLDPLFDMLMDCYLALGNERKRERLLAATLERGDRALRAAALQRRAAMLADRGDFERAWESFREAQRGDPDNVNHATLEITLLMSRGEIAQVRERARFWIARLERRREPELAEMIGWLRAVQADPDKAMADTARQNVPGLDRLAALLAAAPAPEACYEIIDHGDAGRVLEPKQKLASVEARWRKVFPQIKPALNATQHGETPMWEAPEAWLGFLEGQPLVWSSIDVVDDLAMAVEALPAMGIDSAILDPLLERGAALVKANLNAAASAGGTLQWGWLENRPALRVLAHRAYRALHAAERGGGLERFIALAEEMLELNPEDHHFLRAPLTRAYLLNDEPAKVIALMERFPEDFCGPTLNRILALVRLGHRGEALACLMDAARPHRVAIEMLLADAPRRPSKDGAFGVTIGGKEEAWDYRAAHRELWAREGALEWLREAWREVRKRAG